MRRREERGRGGRGARGDGGQAHPAERPEDRERERHEEEIAHRVEERHEIDGAEERTMQRDDGDVREVLVIEELREAELELGDPRVEGVLPVRERLARALDEQQVLRVVVHIGDRHGDLRQERDRVEGHRDGDEEHAEGALDPGQRSAEGVTVRSVSG